MKAPATPLFGARLKALREAAGFTQEELASIAGLSVHAVSALERGQRRRPHVETVRALSAALDLPDSARDELVGSARAGVDEPHVAEPPEGPSLPIPLTRLVGRESEVPAICQLVADPEHRLVTLTGPGGVGKTRLALEVAHALVADDIMRVHFVPLAATRSAAYVASAVAEAIGLPDVSALELPKRAKAVCDRLTLLVLDNFEQVLDAAPLAADLLTAVSCLRLLVTSRAALRVRGEREYAVGPLSLEDAAVRLFVERARDVRPDFDLTPANRPTVTAICRRLDALPLAIELAAPWLKVLRADDLLHRLADDVLLTSVGARDLPARQQTINATVAWSYQLLAPEEQRAFRCFGVLPDRFSIQAAAAVLAGHGHSSTGAALAAAAGLIDKSLLLRAETPSSAVPRYRMLETVRAYAQLELTSAGERDAAQEGLAQYCLNESALAAAGIVGTGQVEWLDRVRYDLANYRASLAWLVERGRAADASRIGSHLLFYWLIRGHAVEGLRWFERIFEVPSLASEDEAKLLLGTAILSFTQGDVSRARAALDRALPLAQAGGDRALVAEVEHVSGHVARATGDVAAARDQLTRSIEVFKELGMAWAAGSALNGLAGIVLASGDAAQGERLLDEATTLLRKAGPWFQMQGLFVRAILAVRQGRADDAIAFVRENLLRIRELHDRFAFVYALIPLAAAAALKGDDEWAARILGARDAVHERTGTGAGDAGVRELRDRAEENARRRLGDEKWTSAYQLGRTTSIESAQDLYRFVFERRQ